MSFVTGRSYRIRNVHSGLYLNLQSYSTAPSAKVEQWPLQSGANRASQVWFVIPIEHDQYLIKNKRSGLYLNVVCNSVSPSSRVEQFTMQTNQSQPAQKWYIRHDPRSGHYMILNQKSNLYLNVAGYSNQPSANIEIFHMHAGGNRNSQLWAFEMEDH